MKEKKFLLVVFLGTAAIAVVALKGIIDVARHNRNFSDLFRYDPENSWKDDWYYQEYLEED